METLQTKNTAYAVTPNNLYPSEEFLLEIKDMETGPNENRPDERAHLFFAGLLYWRYNKELKEIEFLSVEYRERDAGEPRKKFPGGVSLLGETVLDAARRESGQEVGFIPAVTSINLIHDNPIKHRVSRRISHVQCFFLANKYGVTLKTKTDSDDHETSPVAWTSVSDLVKPGEEGGIFFRSHRTALLKACMIIAHTTDTFAHALYPHMENLR